MLLRSIIFISLLVGLSHCSVKILEGSGKEEILNTLKTQTECWNAGDLDCFMDTYWNSDSLVFVGGRGLTYGWHNTLLNYKKGYPNLEAMGTLDFDVLKVEQISKEVYFVIGKWHLTRSIGDLEGYFSLLWKDINGSWVIVADHSS